MASNPRPTETVVTKNQREYSAQGLSVPRSRAFFSPRLYAYLRRAGRRKAPKPSLCPHLSAQATGAYLPRTYGLTLSRPRRTIWSSPGPHETGRVTKTSHSDAPPQRAHRTASSWPGRTRPAGTRSSLIHVRPRSFLCDARHPFKEPHCSNLRDGMHAARVNRLKRGGGVSLTATIDARRGGGGTERRCVRASDPDAPQPARAPASSIEPRKNPRKSTWRRKHDKENVSLIYCVLRPRLLHTHTEQARRTPLNPSGRAACWPAAASAQPRQSKQATRTQTKNAAVVPAQKKSAVRQNVRLTRPGGGHCVATPGFRTQAGSALLLHPAPPASRLTDI